MFNQGCCFLGMTEGLGEESVVSPVNPTPVKPMRPSLAKIILSLDTIGAKQQALSHILSALQIIYAR